MNRQRSVPFKRIPDPATFRPTSVSVCIPTYNGREHLAECINSIRAQTFTDFEVVVCDDQSSDGTLDCARELAYADDRFRFISNPRRLGLVGNWNKCVSEARGEWIKFVFQDDTIAPTCVEALLSACRLHDKPFAFCGRDFIFEDGIPDALQTWFLGHRLKLYSDYCLNSVIHPEQVIRFAAKDPSCNRVGEPTVALIRRSLFNELGGFDKALIQLCDTEFWYRVMVNYGAVFVPENLAAFRLHARAATIHNQLRRGFRHGVLDPLVIRYRLAFAPQFKAMRNFKVFPLMALMLRLKCASCAANAWKEANRLPNTAGGSGAEDALGEWKQIESSCPGIQMLVVPGLAINACRDLWRKLRRIVVQPAVG